MAKINETDLETLQNLLFLEAKKLDFYFWIKTLEKH